MAPNLNFLLIATAIIAAFLIEHGNHMRIAAPDQPDRSATFAGTTTDAEGSREPGGRIHSVRDPHF